MDITPCIPEGKLIIQSYGKGVFCISDVEYSGNIFIGLNKVVEWNVTDVGSLLSDDFSGLDLSVLDVLLIGCGKEHVPLSDEIEKYFVSNDVAVEIMTTGAACRTYNVLLAEGRDVGCCLVGNDL